MIELLLASLQTSSATRFVMFCDAKMPEDCIIHRDQKTVMAADDVSAPDVRLDECNRKFQIYADKRYSHRPTIHICDLRVGVRIEL